MLAASWGQAAFACPDLSCAFRARAPASWIQCRQVECISRRHRAGLRSTVADVLPASVVKDDQVASEEFIDYASLKVGDELNGEVVTELEGRTGRKAWVEANVRRLNKAGQRVSVTAMVRLNEAPENAAKKVRVGKSVKVYVSVVREYSGRLEATLTPPDMLSLVTARQAFRKQEQRQPEQDLTQLTPLDTLTVGMPISGVVVSTEYAGAFLDCGVSRNTSKGLERINGMLRQRDLAEGWIVDKQRVRSKDTLGIISKGQEMQVYVKSARTADQRYSLTMDPDWTPEKLRAARQKAAALKRKNQRRKKLEDLRVGRERAGTVFKVAQYGFLVDVGAVRYGLVHRNDIAEALGRSVKDLSTLAEEGDQVLVTVNSVKDGRLSLGWVGRRQKEEEGDSDTEFIAYGDGEGRFEGPGLEGLDWDEAPDGEETPLSLLDQAKAAVAVDPTSKPAPKEPARKQSPAPPQRRFIDMPSDSDSEDDEDDEVDYSIYDDY